MIYKTPYGTYNVNIIKTNYSTNNNLAIILNNDREGQVAVLTTNLDIPLKEEYGFVDTNNNPTAEEFIKENQLGEFTGAYQQSGYCTYPLYKFNLEKLK
ncbi:MAG: DUF4313 domain-containing protein [Methanobrevibacter sp.]|nr:DUF4313 domain-containing protein [Methanobrevibacter sp.]